MSQSTAIRRETFARARVKSLLQRTNNGQHVGAAENLALAIDIVRKHPDPAILVIRVNSETVGGDILIENRERIVDAQLLDSDVNPQAALLVLLSESNAQYEVLKLGQLVTVPGAMLNVSLKEVGQDVEALIRRRQLRSITTSDVHTLVHSGVHRASPKPPAVRGINSLSGLANASKVSCQKASSSIIYCWSSPRFTSPCYHSAARTECPILLGTN